MKPTPQLAAALDAILQPWDRADAPGAAAAIGSSEGWIWRRAVGAADVQSRVPNTVATRFRVGSISKQFLCAVVFTLADEGLIDLAASVRRYLPELSEGFEPVKVLHLTDHTSGIWCHITTGFLVNGRGLYPPLSNEEIFDLVAGQRQPAFAPGSDTSYSNGGSVLLSRLVERVENMSLKEVLERRLFAPLGMTATSLVPRDSDLEPGMAVCHVPLPDGRFERGFMPFSMNGEGGVVSTLDDMLIWLNELETPAVLSPSVLAQMDTPVRLASGFEPTFRRGIMRTQYRGLEIAFHDGGVIGGMARAGRVPALGIHFVTFGNRADFLLNPVSRGLIDAVAGSKLTAPAPQRPSQAWSGTFHRKGTARVYRFEDNEGVPLVDISGSPAPLVVDGEGQRCDTAETSDIRFHLSADVQILTADERGTRREYKRLADGFSPSAHEVATLVGRYFSEDLRTDAFVSAEGSQPLLEMRGPLGCRRYCLVPLGPGLWRMDVTDPPSSRASSPILEVIENGFRVGSFRATVDFGKRA